LCAQWHPETAASNHGTQVAAAVGKGRQKQAAVAGAGEPARGGAASRQASAAVPRRRLFQCAVRQAVQCDQGGTSQQEGNPRSNENGNERRGIIRRKKRAAAGGVRGSAQCGRRGDRGRHLAALRASAKAGGRQGIHPRYPRW